MLIVYDGLFGTSAETPKDEPLRFGRKGSAVSARRPLVIVFAGWRDIACGLRAATSWRGVSRRHSGSREITIMTQCPAGAYGTHRADANLHELQQAE